MLEQPLQPLGSATEDDESGMTYQVRKAEHDAQCNANLKGSSESMEPVGIDSMLKRSIEKHNVLYASFYCDGATKAMIG